MTFSTDPDHLKIKCKLIFMCGKNSKLAKPATFSLCGRALPWMASATHLGHKIHESGDMSHDANVKRAQYISKRGKCRTHTQKKNTLLCSTQKVHPNINSRTEFFSACRHRSKLLLVPTDRKTKGWDII